MEQTKSAFFKIPPEGFNPLTASDKELMLYGIVPRPDPKLDPHNYKLWERVFSKKLTYISPNIEEHTKTGSTVRPDTTVSNFAGVELTDSNSAQYNFQWISGSWIIPQISFPGFLGDLILPPPHHLQIFIELNANPSNYSTNYNIGLGTKQTISQVLVRNEKFTSQAYFSINNQVTVINNFDFDVGDSITCLVCLNTSNPNPPIAGQAYLTLVNNTKSIHLPLPANNIMVTNFAMARWGISNDNNPLAEYYPPVDITVARAQAIVTTRTNNNGVAEVVNSNIGAIVNYVDSVSDKITSFAKIAGTEEIKITFSNPLDAS